MDYLTWGKQSLQELLRSRSTGDSDKQCLTSYQDNYRTFSFPVTDKVQIFLLRENYRISKLLSPLNCVLIQYRLKPMLVIEHDLEEENLIE